MITKPDCIPVVCRSHACINLIVIKICYILVIDFTENPCFDAWNIIMELTNSCTAHNHQRAYQNFLCRISTNYPSCYHSIQDHRLSLIRLPSPLLRQLLKSRFKYIVGIISITCFLFSTIGLTKITRLSTN